MPLIHVTMIEGRTAEQKRELLAAITQSVHEAIDAPLDSIRAWITDVPAEQFMSAGTMASDISIGSSEPPAATLPGGDDTSPGSALDPPIDPIMAPGGPGQLP